MLESDGPGGAEMMLVHLAEGLRERGFEICPVLPDNGVGWLAARFTERGFQPEVFSLRRPVDWRCVRGLARLFRRRRIDLVHSHEFTMAVYGAVACRLASTPHVITLHGSRRFGERWRRRAALGWAIRHSRAVAAVSTSLARYTENRLGLPHDTVTVVPNGIRFTAGDPVPVRAELKLVPDESLIVAVGNLYPVKGHIVLLRALKRIVLEQPALRWRCAIAGRGDEEAALREFIGSAGLMGRVHLLGYRADVPDILAAADIWAMPSLSEGLPLALLEAMMAGKPVVASAVGAIPDLLEGGAGLLVPPGDDAALSTALYRLLTDATLRRSLAGVASARADCQYRLEHMVSAYLKLYGLTPA